MRLFEQLGMIGSLALLLAASAASGANKPEAKLPPKATSSAPGARNPDLRLSPKAIALVEALGSDDYAQRAGAQQALIKLGYAHVAALRGALAETKDLEVRTRLRRIIRTITTPNWLTDLDQARRQARRTGKPILVFSTIGAPDGYS